VTDLFGPAPADAVFDDMVDRRRALHRRPELAFAEHETTAMIRDHMATLGIAETLRTTETGGIFTMEGGRPGRSVVLRGDIDGLPVQEDEARTVHSDVEGVMHACGHDVHVASLFGAASLLAAGARTSRAATSSSSSRPRRRCAAPRRCSSGARSPPWRARASSGST
jgi:metal-dependent amidase/aminoacylase/carboxypeptidase family protein